MDIFLLLAGLAGLWLGTDLTLRGAISIASKLGMSEFIAGVAILSVGSDLPELSIAISAAVRNLQMGQASDVVVGSALGSVLPRPIKATKTNVRNRPLDCLSIAVVSSTIAPICFQLEAPDNLTLSAC